MMTNNILVNVLAVWLLVFIPLALGLRIIYLSWPSWRRRWNSWLTKRKFIRKSNEAARKRK